MKQRRDRFILIASVLLHHGANGQQVREHRYATLLARIASVKLNGKFDCAS
jgi:hypothetical protein